MTQLTNGHPRLYLNMYRSLVGIGLICGVIIILVYQLTMPIIAANKSAATQQAISQVLPKVIRQQGFVLTQAGQFQLLEPSEKRADLYAVYDEHNALSGFAIPAIGMGYQDVIELIYGYDLRQERIVGMHVLSSRETPGLGSRIEQDENYLRNYRNLDVRLDESKSHLLNSIQIVKPGQKQTDWQIDTISGATVSSKAAAQIVTDSAIQWIPLLRARQEDFNLVP